MTDERDNVLASLEGLRRRGAAWEANLERLKSGKLRLGDNNSEASGGVRLTSFKAVLAAETPKPAPARQRQRQRTKGALLNEHDVAHMLSVSVQTIRRWRLLKRGPKCVKVGFHVRYRAEDITAWLNAQPTGGGK